VKFKVAWIGKTKEAAIQSLPDEYLKRLWRYGEVEGISLKDEESLLKAFGCNGRGSPRPVRVLLESQGKQLSSEELAK